MDTIDRGAIAAASAQHDHASPLPTDLEKHALAHTGKPVETSSRLAVFLSNLILESNKDIEAQQDVPPLKGLSFLDRFLVVWIVLAMAVGILLGNFVPSTGPALQQSTFVGVSVPIAVGLLVMMYPILCKVRFETVSFEFLLGRGQIPRLSHTYTHPH